MDKITWAWTAIAALITLFAFFGGLEFHRILLYIIGPYLAIGLGLLGLTSMNQRREKDCEDMEKLTVIGRATGSRELIDPFLVGLEKRLYKKWPFNKLLEWFRKLR